MLFDLAHILYMVISSLGIAAALVLAHLFLKDSRGRECFLKWVAALTVVIHYSNIWVEFFANRGSTVGLEGSHLFPRYPCHIMMWLLFITAFVKNKNGAVFKVLSEFCFWGGIICATFGTVLNTNYEANPNLSDWFILKGLLSHSTLLLGCIYMRVGGFMRLRMSNILSAAAGLMLFIVDGLFANWLYEICGLPEVNAMFLLYSPYPELPWLSPWTMGLLGLTFLFVVLSLLELTLPREERWYSLLREKIKKINQRKASE